MAKLIYLLIFTIAAATCVAAGAHGHYSECSAWLIIVVLVYIQLGKEEDI